MQGMGWARCPGTCGEWVQGARAGVPFLVDSPVECFSEVFVELDTDLPAWELPEEKEKSYRALSLLAREVGYSGKGRVHFLSSLPTGKGMASSTADIAATGAAFLRALTLEPEAERLAALALRIEPSDSIMYPGITLMNHIQGGGSENLGSALPAQFLALDSGGVVDTLTFNARQDLAGHYQRFEPEIAAALALVKEGLREGDLEKLAKGSSISARCNQAINPKPHFKEFAVWVRQEGGLGLITAHSGTLLAGVFPGTGSLDNLLAEAKERFLPKHVQVLQARDGGVESGGREKMGGHD